jgi:hypothetical protein
LVATLAASVSAQSNSSAHPAVVVELFTSEGCSSCPPADALLLRLEQQSLPGVEIVPLGFHVDYWNELGWKDRFSSHQFTERQNDYARRFGLDSVYTPEIVVDGRFDAVGNDAAEVRQRIAEAARTPKANVHIACEGADVKVSVSDALSGAAQVWLAVTETGLSTNIAGGENRGAQLHHAAVVRSLKLLGDVTGGRFSVTQPLTLLPQWQRANLRLVVLVQDKGGAILGAASAPAPDIAARP